MGDRILTWFFSVSLFSLPYSLGRGHRRQEGRFSLLGEGIHGARAWKYIPHGAPQRFLDRLQPSCLPKVQDLGHASAGIIRDSHRHIPHSSSLYNKLQVPFGCMIEYESLPPQEIGCGAVRSQDLVTLGYIRTIPLFQAHRWPDPEK